MLADYFLENVPNLGTGLLDHLLGGLDRGSKTFQFQLTKDKRFEELKRHLLWQPTLVQLESGAHHDHRTPRIINTFAEQVLSKAPLFALNHIGQGFQLAFIRPSDGLATPTVVEQRIYCFL